QLVQRRLADQSLDLRAELVIRGAALEGAIEQIEPADAEVVTVVDAVPVFEAQRLVLRQRVLDSDHHVRAIGRTTELVADALTVFIECEDRVRFGRTVAVDVEANRRLARDEGTAQAGVEPV